MFSTISEATNAKTFVFSARLLVLVDREREREKERVGGRGRGLWGGGLYIRASCTNKLSLIMRIWRRCHRGIMSRNFIEQPGGVEEPAGRGVQGGWPELIEF